MVELSSATRTRSLPGAALFAMARSIAAIWSSLLGIGFGLEAKKGWLRPTRRGCLSSRFLAFWSAGGFDTEFRWFSPSTELTLGGRDLRLLDAVLEAL